MVDEIHSIVVTLGLFAVVVLVLLALGKLGVNALILVPLGFVLFLGLPALFGSSVNDSPEDRWAVFGFVVILTGLALLAALQVKKRSEAEQAARWDRARAAAEIKQIGGQLRKGTPGPKVNELGERLEVLSKDLRATEDDPDLS